MKETQIQRCPHCNSSNIGIGYQLGSGGLFADRDAYHSGARCSEIETYFCKNCGSVLLQKVKRPEIFEAAGTARGEELLEHIEKNGFLMLNAHKTLPSVSSLGYSMQDLVSLIENRKVFYCKALGKKPVYLSVTAYQLLKRAKPAAPLSEAAKEILKAMEKREAVDKADLKLLFPMDAKAFQKEFDYLLEHLYLTACAGKKLNSNWYSCLYCTARKFDRCVEGLHFHGNPKEALWNLVKGAMDKKNFELLCK